MASPSSEAEASEIRRRGRRRLIGAVVLVAVLVVVIPMVLDSEPRPSRSTPVAAIPPKDSVAPLPTPKPAPVAPAQPVAPAPSVTPAQAGAQSPDAGKPASPPPSTPQPAKAAEAPKLEGFAVQVGAFRDEAKLKQSREKLTGAGIVHYTERLDAKAGPLTRLRAGPFATREEAEAALAKLKLSALDGKVVPLP